ncbi:two-component system, NtrC family, nitrogen regulation sensor histidine kinase GlnL [Lampropedia hyalina DSM 16112]|jgi:two-component system nitrogen regulation sensor histidine kinase GlnL|uniref:Sensory histidine kinase/phosphatase NtrB n=1 Tax=Lampropedia hyalina DSM 16112 TaxID=1122156 RepID=A0A1M5DC88_9BURK|nr:nitrogen regulation protein NR(II) [Lampropedia hyalina]SHF64619.1 two-component system, NtrC family, nitrogen regulation sensor histidine kinase GlnL [Lampropedia hyalina DSM 16112]
MLFNLDSLTTLIALIDNEGRIQYANAALENALGLSRKRMGGMHFAHFLEEPELLEQALRKAQNSRHYSVFHFDAALHGMLNTPLSNVQINLLRAEKPSGWMLELWPLKEQSRLHNDERFQEQAEANKMLLRNLAHEIKNPLGGIRGAAQLLEMELGHSSLDEYTQVIIHEADRLQNLLDRLLEPHRHPQKLEMVNIHEVCEHVRSLVLLEYPHGLHIVQDYDISLPDFLGDKNQLIQTLLNIVRNAAQALAQRIAHNDGTIELRTRAAWQVTVGRQLHKLALQLHVIDNGPGISEELRDRIFLPLVSGRDGGSGLGLSLAQTFIQRHGGMIECNSSPGRTEFIVTIPLA